MLDTVWCGKGNIGLHLALKSKLMPSLLRGMQSSSVMERMVNGLLPHPSSIAEWMPPPEGCLKCNFDAVIFSNSGKVGYGEVVRNSGGSLVSARNSLLHCI